MDAEAQSSRGAEPGRRRVAVRRAVLVIGCASVAAAVPFALAALGMASGGDAAPRLLVEAAFLSTETAVLMTVLSRPRHAARPAQAAGTSPDIHLAEIETLESRRQEALRQLDDLEASLDALRRNVTPCLSRLAGSSDTLNGAADDISRAALRVSSEATSATIAAEDASRKVETVAAAGQDFMTTISRIGELAARSARMGGEAVAQAEGTSKAFDELTNMSEQIGSVTSLIAGIASQTNLLALNATIEAARAGEQGRGFAVVAGEVKSLARETTNAVGTIGEMVERIRGVTERSVVAVGSIAASIRKLNEDMRSIAGAVEDRVVVAAGMADSAGIAASNVRHVLTAMGTIETLADETIQGAGFLRATAGEIADQTGQIGDALEQPANGATRARPLAPEAPSRLIPSVPVSRAALAS